MFIIVTTILQLLMGIMNVVNFINKKIKKLQVNETTGCQLILIESTLAT